MTWSDAKCVHCGRPISFTQQHAFGGVCEDAKCKSKQLTAWLAEKHSTDQQRMQRRQQVALAASESILDTSSTNKLQQATNSANRQVFAVPAMLRPLTKLPDHRRTEFETHLTSMVDASFQENERVVSQDIDADRLVTDGPGAKPLPIVSAACGACQGDCCQNGSTHAFVSAKLIDRIRQENPGISPQEVIDIYLSYLPQRSFEESCVYHQANGCALPRAMRTDLCNHFECDDLHFIRTQSRSSPAVLVALEGTTPVRIVEFDQSATIENG